MAKIHIMGAGESFSLNGKEYLGLKGFTGKASLLGLKTKVTTNAFNTVLSLYVQCSYYAQPGDFVIIINDPANQSGDICREMLRDFFKLGSCLNERMARQIETDKDKYGDLPEETLAQLPMLPEGSIFINNQTGTDPGYVIDIQDKLYFVLPAQPEELFNMLGACVLPIMANLSEREMAVRKITSTGLELLALEVKLSKLFKKEEAAAVHYEFVPGGETTEIELTAFAEKTEEAEFQAERMAKAVRNHLWPNIIEERAGEMAEALTEILQGKKIRLAAAVTGKDLKREFASLPDGAFQYILNAEPMAVRETVFEVPRSLLHENGGFNRKAAMHIARKTAELCGAEAGFALLVDQDEMKAVMALSAAERITCQEFSFTGGMDFPEKAGFACKSAVYFCTAALANYPDNIPDSVSAAEFMPVPEERHAAFGFWRAERQNAGA